MSSFVNIRNVAIIAHIDHGKTTLLDRFIQFLSNEKSVYKKDRVADVLELEQERGITIKMQPVSLYFNDVLINFVDTPGHVDFGYEVSRALKAVEGVVLLIDVTQGIQAQTIENLLTALKYDLSIIPVLNKVDLADSELIERRLIEIKNVLGFGRSEVILASGKTGKNVDLILRNIVEHIPPPTNGALFKEVMGKIKHRNKASSELPVAFVIDAQYDNYGGVVLTVRVVSGAVGANAPFVISNEDIEFNPIEVGVFSPMRTSQKQLTVGQIGYIVTNIKDPKHIYVGATITTKGNRLVISGYRRPVPKVFSSFYPAQDYTYDQLREALAKLKLNDFALSIEQDSSPLLGKGFKLGFLGMLHMEIIKERLAREFAVEVVTTYPLVPYKVKLKNGSKYTISSIRQFPSSQEIDTVWEPFINAEIFTPFEHLSAILDLLRQSRSVVLEQQQLNMEGVDMFYYKIKAQIPFSEIVDNFFNRLKSVSHGYASLSYEDISYLPSSAVKVDILVMGDIYENLSFITYPEKAQSKARSILKVLKKSIPRTIVPIPLQAAIGGKIIARETIPAMRKNVTAKLYGGDVRRKLKLLRNQARLKKYRSQFVKVKIPSDFLRQVLSDV